MNEDEWLGCTDPTPMLKFLRGPMSTSTQTKLIWGREVALTGYFHQRISDRKARLFACACCRRFWHLLDEVHCCHLLDYARSLASFDGRELIEPPVDMCHRAVELSERSVDEKVLSDELHALSKAVSAFYWPASDYCSCYDESMGPFDAELVASGEAAEAVHHACSQNVDVFGQPTGPFDSLAFVVEWTTKAASSLRRTGAGRGSAVGGTDEREAQCALLREIVGNPFRPVHIDPAWLTNNDGTVVKLAHAIYDDRAFDRLPILADALLEAGCDDADILGHCRQQGAVHVRGCWLVDLLTGRS